MPGPSRKKSAKSASKPASKKAAKKATGKKPAAKKPVAKRAGTPAPAAKRAGPPAPAKKKTAGKKPAAKRAGTPALVAKKQPPKRPKVAARPEEAGRRGDPDPEGFFVARVRGEDAARDAPHLLLEPGGWEDETPAPALHDEGLGELPWTYGDDLLVALPRDPRTLFVYWDQARSTVDAAFAGVPDAKVQLWIFGGGGQWDRVRVVDVALEARGWYVHDLQPGRTYRAELHVVGSGGQDRRLPSPSVSTALPPQGPSPVVDDRFATLPWDVPLPKLMGPGVPGGPFSEEARAVLARLSGWERFGHSHAGAGPTSPAGGPSSPSRRPGPEGH